MSIKMLKDFNNLKNNDINLLKLSMSYIVSTLNGDDEVYRKYIDNDFFWKIVDKCVYQPLNYVTEEEKAEIKKVCNSIIKEAKRSISSGVVAVLKEQLKLAEEEKRDSPVYQALQAMSYLLNGFEVWPKTAKESEAQKVSRINDLTNIFFKDCSLNTKIGETIGDATKHAYVFNESNFSSNSASASASASALSALSCCSASTISSSNSGRKIDLIVKDDKCFELAFCEFKAENKKTTTNHQQGKTLRLNLTILEEMKKLFVDEQVISFVWTGPFGAFFSLQESQDVFVARFAEPFIWVAR
ncbi:hypothetical protein EDC96DRAFT_518368 [Choanephora cucurbitarum]|nr:hypothetical protein EDC96DRAFT_518368 [Choanephora cucurbitarum]